ncbi:FAD-binding oxidoreductase [Weeksellaceae bacterium KMM 9724]|uniref:NAD(P)/FAD-dependent oxidoreductase n=1 Tax=Profundicola chukchiensis TaxID=2961959 RepID=UPI002437F88C|nr:FAD-dependent oxidoreductase [Profundicola chukchiensis]MDG4951369.1 FAD-binding oxidoreductase [Profundicola chukchiensis]
MDLHTGLPFWLIKNGLAYNYSSLKKDRKTQVVILGGGITGAIQAYFLAKAGIDFILLEKRSIGLGSTSASTALLQYQIDEPLSSLIEKVGESNAVRAYELCAESIETIKSISKDIGHDNYQVHPTLFYASYKKDVALIEKEYELHKSAGFDVDLWDQKKIKKHFDLDFPAALYSRHSAQIDAYKFCHQCMQYALKKGQQIYDRTEVVDIKHKKDGVKIETADGYTIQAEWLIYATGYEVVDFISKDIVDLNSTWAIVSEQFDDVKEFWHENALIWETKEPYLYMRTTADRRIMLGGRDENTNNPQRRQEALKEKSKKLAKDFAKLFPQYEFVPEFSWAGTFGSTKDGLPYIGKFKNKPQGLFALGFGGNGITFSTIAGELLRDIILGKENDDVKIFAFDR